MADAPLPTPRPGRSLAWRGGMALTGALCVGTGVALVLWPAILAYVVAAGFASLGAFLLLTSVAARSRDAGVR